MKMMEFFASCADGHHHHHRYDYHHPAFPFHHPHLRPPLSAECPGGISVTRNDPREEEMAEGEDASRADGVPGPKPACPDGCLDPS